MFYYRFTIRPGGAALMARPTYHHFLREKFAGDYVTGALAQGATEVRVKKINQATYNRHSRAGQ